MDISNPLVKQAYELSLAIEKIDASEQQTNASIKASELSSAIAQDQIIKENLSMLLRRIITKHQRGKLDDEFCQKALDYLKRKELQGSVLRAA